MLRLCFRTVENGISFDVSKDETRVLGRTPWIMYTTCMGPSKVSLSRVVHRQLIHESHDPQGWANQVRATTARLLSLV
jgi:hypothetical protein